MNALGEPHYRIGSVRGTIRGGLLEIRHKPQALAQIVGRLRVGDTVKILGHAPGWFFIQRSDGLVGWVPLLGVTAKLDWEELNEVL